jgi:tagatose 6-phosphate kinase
MIVCLGTTPTMQRTMTFAQIRLDSVNRAKSVQEYASGKSTNAARVLHTLGNQVLASGFLGGDRAGPFRADLDHAGIAHDFVTVDAPTRLCTTVIDQSSGTATELIEESHPVTAADSEQLLAKLATLLVRARYLVLSGHLPLGAGSDFYARCVRLAEPKVRVILDAVGSPLLEALPFKPFVIKPNQSEVGRTLGIDVDSEKALRDGMVELVSRGAAWVIVTRGSAGTLVSNGQSFWQVSTPSVKVISSIGSGDAFAAGLASALARGDDMPQACILAAACGAANAMTADAGHIQTEHVYRLAKNVQLTRI